MCNSNFPPAPHASVASVASAQRFGTGVCTLRFGVHLFLSPFQFTSFFVFTKTTTPIEQANTEVLVVPSFVHLFVIIVTITISKLRFLNMAKEMAAVVAAAAESRGIGYQGQLVRPSIGSCVL